MNHSSFSSIFSAVHMHYSAVQSKGGKMHKNGLTKNTLIGKKQKKSYFKNQFISE